MDFMTLLGAVIAVFFHSGFVSRVNGQRICRRGTERPCYRVFYIQDFRRRLTFADASRACQSDGGELLSIETESEQRLIERFVTELQVGDGDFWIGLRRNPQRLKPEAASPVCPSQYYWLDGSKAKFRNWHWDEPSCGAEMCVVLYHQPSAPPDEEGHFLFQWNDDNCSSKNNFVCKYTERKAFAFTEKNTARLVPTLRSNIVPTTDSSEKIKAGLPESSLTQWLYEWTAWRLYFPSQWFLGRCRTNCFVGFLVRGAEKTFQETTVMESKGAMLTTHTAAGSLQVSLTDDSISYILYATIPALLLLLVGAVGFFCYRHHVKRQKTELENYPGQHQQWMSVAASPCSVQGPYAFSDVTKLPPIVLECSVTRPTCTPPFTFQCDDYENVPSADRGTGFVTNDIYESHRCHNQTGWVENEIYG